MVAFFFFFFFFVQLILHVLLLDLIQATVKFNFIQLLFLAKRGDATATGHATPLFFATAVTMFLVDADEVMKFDPTFLLLK